MPSILVQGYAPVSERHSILIETKLQYPRVPGAPVPDQATGPDRARRLRHRILPHTRLFRQPSSLLLAQGGVHRAALQVSNNLHRILKDWSKP